MSALHNFVTSDADASWSTCQFFWSQLDYIFHLQTGLYTKNVMQNHTIYESGEIVSTCTKFNKRVVHFDNTSAEGIYVALALTLYVAPAFFFECFIIPQHLSMVFLLSLALQIATPLLLLLQNRKLPSE